jgi:cell wall-associated NlpC family hydrolase
MTKTLPGAALPRRIVTVLIAALFSLTLALNPMSAPNANAVVSASVGLSALHVAAAQRGIPYRYGGASPRTGFDCSGLTMYSYARVGRYIPRVAQQQYLATIRVGAWARRQGDLAFFYTGRTVYHVGIYAGGGYMIDAPHSGAVVRMERIWSSYVLYGRVR